MAANLATVGLTPTTSVERTPGRRAGKAVRAGAGLLGVLAVALGLALRIWTIGRAPMNSDQATVGLMAREILNGHFFAFYWGQPYGGVEPYVTAVLFGVFGQSSFALAMTAIILDAAATVLLWRIGRRLFQPIVGAGAALLFWLWPEVILHQSTIEYGFRWAALVLGLSMLLIALRLCDDPPVPRPRLVVAHDWVLLGAALGLGWWSTPEIAYYALPAAVLLGYHVLRRGLRPGLAEVLAAVGAAVLGALPWLWDNVGRGFPSLHSAPQGPGNAGFVHHLHLFAIYTLPMLLGLRLRGTGAWLFLPPLAKALYVLFLVAGVAVLVACLVRRRAVVLVVCCVLAPLVYAYNPATWYWQDGRYGIFLAPMAALVAVAGAEGLSGVLRLRNRPVLLRLAVQRAAGPMLAVALGIAFTLAAVSDLAPYRPASAQGDSGWFSWHVDPNAYLDPVVSGLEQAGVTGVYAGYWVAYDLGFESDGGLTVSDLTYARYLPYLDAIESDSHTAWLFPSARGAAQLGAEGLPVNNLAVGCIGGTNSANPSASACLTRAELQSYLRDTNDPFRLLRVGGFIAVLPSNPALPQAVLVSAHITGGPNPS